MRIPVRARAGSRHAIPCPPWDIEFTTEAGAQLDWLLGRGVDLRSAIVAALGLGPHPHPYRRIRVHGDGMRLALKEWRIDFRVEGRRAVVGRLCTGYRRQELASETSPDEELERRRELHRAFVRQWGEP